MMRKLLITLLMGILSVVLLQAQTPAQSAPRLVARSGIVEVQRNNTWSPIAAGDPISAGDRIRTASGSSAALELGPGKIITLNPGTEIQVRDGNGSPSVQLESGNMKVFAATDIQIAVKDTVLQSVERPLDMQVGVQADRLNLMVLSGAVRNGAVTIRGAEDTNVRTYTANGHSLHHGYSYPYSGLYSNFYVYPYIMYGNGGTYGNAGTGTIGGIVPPTVFNPTNPGYRPDQIVPPMSDPIRVPIQIRPNR